MPIRVGADVWTVWSLIDTDIDSVAIHLSEKSVHARLNGMDYLIASPPPVVSTEVSDAFVWVVPRLLVNARDL